MKNWLGDLARNFLSFLKLIITFCEIQNIIKKQEVWDLFVVPLTWKKILLLFICDFPENKHTRGGKEGIVQQ